MRRRRLYGLIFGSGRIQSSELRRRALEQGFSTRTLYKALKHLSDAGTLRRIVDDATMPPRVFYETIPRRPSGSVNLERARQIVENQWSPRKERERDGMALAFSWFTNQVALVILDACGQKDERQAQKYLDVQMQTRLDRYVHELFRMCFRRRNITVDKVPVLACVADSFLTEEEDADDWLKRHAPKWAKTYIERVPIFRTEIPVILMLATDKEAAIKEMEELIEDIEARGFPRAPKRAGFHII